MRRVDETDDSESEGSTSRSDTLERASSKEEQAKKEEESDRLALAQAELQFALSTVLNSAERKEVRRIKDRTPHPDEKVHKHALDLLVTLTLFP